MKDAGSLPLGDAMHDALQAFGMERKIKEHEIILRWEELVGPVIAGHAKPLRFANGKLWVSVEDAAWRHQLSLDRIAMKDRLNAALGMAIVDEVVLR